MKRVWVLFLGVVLFGLGAVAYAGPFDTIDADAGKVAKFIEDYLGEQWKSKVLAEYPGAAVTFGSRPTLGSGTASSGYVVYVEVKQPNKEPAYYYFEVVITNVNEVPELRAKYGI